MSDERQTEDREKVPSCNMFVDKEGRWFHKGAPIIHSALIALFYQCLDVNEEGDYLIRLHGQVCRLDVEDTPFVIVRTDFVAGASPGEKDCLLLRLIDDTEEALDPETLFVGADHVMYCRIRDGKFRARFLRSSYYQLAEHIDHEPETGKYFLLLNTRKYYII